ncbi:MAG: hypothetical protein SFY95_11780 [Planctomycetota bacterium]|nr:hypothetical protein [Planctomycetota bacterium]
MSSARARALARAASNAHHDAPLDPDLGPIPFLAHAQAAGRAVSLPDRDEYDALADLFLGDDRPVASEPPEPEDLASLIARGPGTLAPESEDVAGTESAEGDIVTTSCQSVSRDDGRSVLSSASIEGVVLGHLPVLGSIWLTQLARHRARTLGRPVGVVRISAQDALMDLVIPAPTGRVIAAQSFADAVAQASAMGVRDWLVRVPEADEAALLSLSASGLVGAMTILTGADDAAIVSAYRTLKGLVRASGRDDAPVRVAVMGASPARAHEARLKLADVCRQFLSRQLEVEACDQQISGGGSTLTLFRGARPADVQDVIAALRSHAGPAEVRCSEVALPAFGSVPDMVSATVSMPALEDLLPAMIAPAPAATSSVVRSQAPMPTASAPSELEWDAEFRPSRTPASRTERTPTTPPLAAPTKISPEHAANAGASTPTRATKAAPTVDVTTPAAPTLQAEGALESAAASPSLKGAARLGLRPVKAKCPYARSIELAVDAANALHVISSDGSEQGVQELAAASAWAQTNAELLADAYGIDASAPIARHVLTRKPGSMRGLIDSDLKLHALAKADADGWACVPLNG